MSAVRSSPELVALGRDGKGEDRFTSRDMIAAEQRLERAAEGLAINLDGEPLAGDAMRFAVRKGALKVHLPQGSPLLGQSELRVS